MGARGAHRAVAVRAVTGPGLHHGAMTTKPAPDLLSLPWRTGRQTEGDLGMGIVYAQLGDEASPDNVLIGMMNSPAMAAEVCAAHNARLAAKLARHPLA